MENFISTRTKEFASTHPTRAREKDYNYDFRCVLSAGVIDQQPMIDDRVNRERGIDGETTPCSTILLLAAVKEGRGSPAVPSTASHVFQISFCRIRKLDLASASDLRY